MKLVIQRVKSASVSIDGQVYNAIQQGLLLLVGVGPEDDQKDLDYAVRKVSQMRIFSDEEDKMNLSVKDIQGEILSISQFTLFADTKKGNRPAFTGAAKPDMASQLYDAFNDQLEKKSPCQTRDLWSRYGDWIDQWWSSDDFARYKKSISKKTCSRVRLHVFRYRVVGRSLGW